MKNTWVGIDLANKCALSLRLQFIEAAEISLLRCLSVEFT